MKNVVITGAATGIGLATAQLLTTSGWHVFAGSHRGEKMPQSKHLISVPLDITRPEIIAAAVDDVRAYAGTQGLDALVNNAGIVRISPMEHITQKALRQQFEVNVFGTIQVTQAFLPLLKQAKHARIINVLSIQAEMAVPLTGAYSMTKHAMLAFASTLRMELAPAGIDVISIEPGVVRTPMSHHMIEEAERVQQNLPDDAYNDLFEAMKKTWHESEKSAVSAKRVATVIRKALTDRNPHTHYPVTGADRRLSMLARLLPARRIERAMMQRMNIKF